MAKKKDEETSLLETEDLKGLLMSFLREVGGNGDDNPYLTKEGMAFYNGYCQANNTISLIKYEKYEKLLKDYEELIEKYEEIKEQNEQMKTNYNALLTDYKELKNKRWFKW